MKTWPKIHGNHARSVRKPSDPEFHWIIFDARYEYDKDRAAVMGVCDSEEEAEEEAPEYGDGCYISKVRFTGYGKGEKPQYEEVTCWEAGCKPEVDEDD